MYIEIKTNNVNVDTDKLNTNPKKDKEREELNEQLLIVRRLMVENIVKKLSLFQIIQI